MEYKILNNVISPETIKKLNNEEITLLCDEIRNEIIDVVSRNGGHLASSLGTVELTVALHRVFSSPKDAIIFDVGHQSYAHKLLTGRFDKFSTLRKEGGISGPKLLEHMVDAVLYFEGERMQSYRIIRAIKNRFGSTNEIGVFEMTGKGLKEIPNPSQTMMEQRSLNIPGSCACCVMEGTRPLICEIQSLVSPANYSSGKRTVNGFDYNRMCLLLAVLERRVRGLQFSSIRSAPAT